MPLPISKRVSYRKATEPVYIGAKLYIKSVLRAFYLHCLIFFGSYCDTGKGAQNPFTFLGQDKVHDTEEVLKQANLSSITTKRIERFSSEGPGRRGHGRV
ncbi:hypothetical protein ElyMa_005654700 [Elysia marginata]|uniref:Uncharacterized protein n=1 Tax=Elysia marginata TaxID=1093978 RepID=A0AAV4FDQ8_9GAST|nr:hypothetical protein ElyMa_005654700 [Elysia marginata]